MVDDFGDARSDKLLAISPAESSRPDQTQRIDPELVRVASVRQRKGSLLVIAGDVADVGLHRLIEGELVLGREYNGLHLRDGQISRQHALLNFSEDDDAYFISDLDSTNGTLLNGKRVLDTSRLRDGDRIQIGNTVVKFMLVDKTESEYLRRIGRFARTDALTGLVAKHRFDGLLETLLLDAVARDMPFAVLMMDMDNLKAINDRHGHQAGAGTIQEVGGIIGRAVERRGEACRFGGDEFSAFLYGLTQKQAIEVAEDIRATVESTIFKVAGATVRTSISIGLAQRATGKEVRGQELLGAADRALYRAKGQGRNCVSD